MASYNFLPTISSTNQTQTTAPSWQPQVTQLSKAMQGAGEAYDQQKAMGGYTGDYVAAPNQTQYDAYGQAADFAKSNGGVPNTQISTGQGLLSNFSNAEDSAGALYKYGTTDQTQNHINTANAYAQNPYIDQAVNAATYGARRDAAENTLPSLYRSAAAGNNLNSDRTALSEGVVNRGLAENAQNIGASMRQQAWGQGLNAALSQDQMNLGALTNSGTMSSNLGNEGSSMMSQGINDQANLSNIYTTAGSGLNALQQSILNNNIAKHQGAISDMWSPSQNLYSIAGANNWGSKTNTSGTSVGFQPVQNQQRPGALSYLGAGLGVAGSVAGLGMGGGTTLGGQALSSAFPSYFASYPSGRDNSIYY